MAHYHPKEEESRPLNERPVLFDDCEECNQRARSPVEGLCHLDAAHFNAIWRRMEAVEYARDQEMWGDHYLSHNEVSFGRVLYLLTVLGERHPEIVSRAITP